MKHFLVLLKARNIELLRDNATWVWNMVFPVILIVAVATLFGDRDTNLFKVGIIGQDTPALAAFKTTRYVQFIDYANAEAALPKVQHHQLDLLIESGAASRYWLNEDSPKGYFLEKMLLGSGGNWHKEAVSGKQVRYLDWVLPGILGINIMHTSLFGVGLALVKLRKNGVLKRLQATPVNAFEFLSAQVVSRLLLLLAAICVQVIALNFIFGFIIEGSYLLLLLIAALGSLSLISLGLIAASRSNNEEVTIGLLNLVTWPMVLLSGIWFSLEGAPYWLQKAALALPMTHILNAARAVMIDGAGFAEVRTELLVLAGLTLVFLTIASLRFKWNED